MLRLSALRKVNYFPCFPALDPLIGVVKDFAETLVGNVVKYTAVCDGIQHVL